MLTQIDTLNNINSRLTNAKCKTDAAKAKQLEFTLWFGNLEWFDKRIDETTLVRAEQYEALFKEANELNQDTASFGAETDTPTIRRGSKGPAVKRWQGVLGLTGKDLDGAFGPGTEKLTKDYQKKNGLNPDGVVGPATWQRALGKQIKDAINAVPSSQKSLKQVMADQKAVTAAQVKAVNPNVVYVDNKPVALTSSGNPILRKGMKGPEVARWQKIIGANPDKDFGPQTHTLTVAWQKRNGLNADGVVDDPDWAAATVAPPTKIADLEAAVPALKKANANLPDPIKPAAAKAKAKVSAAAKSVKETTTKTVAATKAKVQSMPLWQRVLTGAAVTGCAIFGFQAIAQKMRKSSFGQSPTQSSRLLGP